VTRAFALILGFLTLTGCDAGPRLYKVTGTVTWEGKSVENGRISLIADDGKTAPAAAPIVNGKFELTATAGPKRVEVYNQRVTGFSKEMNQETRTNDIPPAYNAETKLRFEVRPADNNTLDLVLPQK
jgi:hypothetical protein